MAAIKFYIKKDGISATMELHGDEFIVLQGSEACTGWITTNVGGHPRVKELHKELHDKGILQIRGTCSVFTKDYRFSKISHAGGASMDALIMVLDHGNSKAPTQPMPTGKPPN